MMEDAAAEYIVPGHVLNGWAEKRSLDRAAVEARDWGFRREAGQAGDQPWFCWFNQTVFEFFIYAEQTQPTPGLAASLDPPTTAITPSLSFIATSSGPTASTTSADVTPVTFIAPASSAATSYASSDGAKPIETPSTTIASSGLTNQVVAYPNTPTAGRAARPPSMPKRNSKDGDYSQGNNYPDFPRWVKVEEKRRPSNNVQPYCQQMIVNSDLSISVNANQDIIPVREIEPPGPGSQKRTPGAADGSPSTLGSNCVCEWLYNRW